MLDLVKYHFSRNSGRASPSTREAIVGMLTMSQGFATDGSPDHVIAIIVPGSELILEHFFFFFESQTMGLSLANSSAPPVPSVAQRQRKGRRRLNASCSDDYGDIVSKVHQDDEYSKLHH